MQMSIVLKKINNLIKRKILKKKITIHAIPFKNSTAKLKSVSIQSRY